MLWLIKLVREKSKLQNQLLGKLLRQARNEARMTQMQAAAHVARDQTFIARIESGSQQQSFVEVEQLAKAYGKTLADFKTIDQIELGLRSYALTPDTLTAYTEMLLQKQNERRQRKRVRITQRRRKRK